MLIPSEEDIRTAPVLTIYGERPGYQAWGETEPGGVTSQTTKYETVFSFEANGQKQLKSRGLEFGIAAGNSYEDHHMKWGHHHMADLEDKGADGSILAALAQGACTGSNFAMAHLRAGLPWNECIVPVAGNTGLLMSFGATVVLQPSFPTFVPLSKLLDLSDSRERRVAAAYLHKMEQFASRLGQRLQELQTPLAVTKMELCSDKYFIKEITPDAFRKGLGMFSTTHSHLDIDGGLMHMTEVFNALSASPDARPFVEFPISVRTPDWPEQEPSAAERQLLSYDIIFNNLQATGFHTGAPNRLTHPDIFQQFALSAKQAVEAFHLAGVIHGDLYLSNFMWRVNDDGMQVKVVDWDAAHCLWEGEFKPVVKDKLADYLGAEHLQFGPEHDLMYVSVLDLDVTEGNRSLWADLAKSDQKPAIDSAFRTLLGEVLHSRATLM
jgi:hypothetical protein